MPNRLDTPAVSMQINKKTGIVCVCMPMIMSSDEDAPPESAHIFQSLELPGTEEDPSKFDLYANSERIEIHTRLEENDRQKIPTIALMVGNEIKGNTSSGRMTTLIRSFLGQGDPDLLLIRESIRKRLGVCSACDDELHAACLAAVLSD